MDEEDSGAAGDAPLVSGGDEEGFSMMMPPMEVARRVPLLCYLAQMCFGCSPLPLPEAHEPPALLTTEATRSSLFRLQRRLFVVHIIIKLLKLGLEPVSVVIWGPSPFRSGEPVVSERGRPRKQPKGTSSLSHDSMRAIL